MLFMRKKDVINDIMNVYIPDELMSVMGRFFTLEDIRGILPICDVEKEDHGFNLVVYMENETFVIVTDNTGYVVYMMYYPKQLYKSWKFLRIRVGMSLDDVKNIFPCFILYEKAPHILTSEYVLYDTARIEILFSDGKAGIICLEKENGEYYVSDKYYRYQSITDDIIDSLPQGN